MGCIYAQVADKERKMEYDNLFRDVAGGWSLQGG